MFAYLIKHDGDNIMRTLFAIALIISLSILSANFVREMPFEHHQPDGSKLQLYVTGDEFYRRVHDKEDYTVLRHPDNGFAVYAMPDGNSIKASNHMVGSSDPALLNLPPRLFHDTGTRNNIYEIMDRNDGTLTNRAPTIGTINNIHIFIRFSDDDEYIAPYSHFDNMYNSYTGPSMRGYFAEVSNAQLSVTTNMYPLPENGIVRSYQDSHPRAYYLPYHFLTNPIGYGTMSIGQTRRREMLRLAVEYVQASIPSDLNVDADGDGNVDNVTFMVKGFPDAWGHVLWPHFSILLSFPSAYINNKLVSSYNMQFEGSAHIGVFCHEFSHTLGFPDLYHYTEGDTLPVVGYWDLMEWDAAIPQHHLTYMKMKYGQWFTEIPTIAPNWNPTQFTLTAIDQSPYSAYKIMSPLSNQYYVLEYRRRAGYYENSLPGSGLIVSRVMTSFNGNPVNGAADGPPDEIYVYRPGCSITTPGALHEAHLSAQTNRTAIHNQTDPQPWLYSNSHTQLDGNLIISEIGPAGGTTITFTVTDRLPNVWTGALNNVWSNGGNWSTGLVPDQFTNVVIPAGTPSLCVVSSSSAICNSVKIETGGSLQVHGVTLTVQKNLNNYGVLRLTSGSGGLIVNGDLFWETGSTAIVTDANASIGLKGSMTFNPGSNVQVTQGHINLFGSGFSYLINKSSNTQLNNLNMNKDLGYPFYISNESTADITFNGSIWNVNDTDFYNQYSGNVYLKGDLTNGNNTYNDMNWTAGTLVMNGTYQSITLSKPTDRINNLAVQLTGSLTLQTNITMYGDLTINSGLLNANDKTITLQGGWNNTIGPDAFMEGTSRVIFTGLANKYIQKSETFNILELSKSSGSLLINSSNTHVICNSYDWTSGTLVLSNGSFTANALADNYVAGNWNLSNGTINLYNPVGNIDLRGVITISSGSFNVHGGVNVSRWGQFSSLDLTMTDGVLDFKNRGITIADSAFPLGVTLTGGVIKTPGNLIINRSTFRPGGGTFELCGSINTTLSMVANAKLHNLTIHKSVGTNTVTATTDVTLGGAFTLQSGVFTAPALMRIGGNWLNIMGPASFIEGSGIVIFEGSAHSVCGYDEIFNNLELNKAAGYQFSVEGSAQVSCNSYNYTAGVLNVNEGLFTAYDLTDDFISGNVFINNGQAHFHQDTMQWADIQGNLSITDGEMHVYGSMGSFWAASGNSTLHLSNAVLVFHSAGVTVSDTGTVLTTITNSTISVARNFRSLNAEFYLGSSNIIEMTGSTDAWLEFTSFISANIVINKGAREGEADFDIPDLSTERDGNFRNLTRANTVRLNNYTACNNLTINSGILDLNGHELFCQNDVVINSGGTLKLSGGDILKMQGAKTLTVNQGGRLECLGSEQSLSKVTCNVGTFIFNVESGATIAAQNTIFEYMGGNGVHVKTGALVDPDYSFRQCTFSRSSNQGRLLTLDNSQNLHIYGAYFPTNTWNGSCNVAKTVDAGFVNFANATGPYSGSAFESDPHNRILWTTPGSVIDLRFVKVQWSEPSAYMGDTAVLTYTVINESTTDCGLINCDLYYNRTSPPTNHSAYSHRARLSMPAGLPITIEVPVANYDSALSGIWSSYLYVDAGNYVMESNESNNIHGPFFFRWWPLPPVTNLTASYMDIGNQLYINWDYPFSVNRYKIYRSTDPDFIPAPENFYVYRNYPYFVDVFSGAKMFYRVTAERLPPEP